MRHNRLSWRHNRLSWRHNRPVSVFPELVNCNHLGLLSKLKLILLFVRMLSKPRRLQFTSSGKTDTGLLCLHEGLLCLHDSLLCLHDSLVYFSFIFHFSRCFISFFIRFYFPRRFFVFFKLFGRHNRTSFY